VNQRAASPLAGGSSSPSGLRPEVKSIAYLGPRGTFCEAALFTQDDLAALDLVPLATIPEVIAAVQDGRVDVGLVPIENAIEGTVNLAIDALAFDLDLLAPAGVELAQITRVVSIPVATSQCTHWLHENMPGMATLAANSTAEAAQRVAAENDGHTAAIAPARAGEVYGLSTLAAEIEDHPENKTRFLLVAPRGVPSPSGHDKTSLVVFQRADSPGSLLTILQEFAARSINLTKVESRPTKTSLGDYCFIMDIDGHVGDELVADALRNLHAKAASVKFLGSYPAAGAHGETKREAANHAWSDAAAWIDAIRTQIR
jgi:prephenate dehydratase